MYHTVPSRISEYYKRQRRKERENENERRERERGKHAHRGKSLLSRTSKKIILFHQFWFLKIIFIFDLTMIQWMCHNKKIEAYFTIYWIIIFLIWVRNSRSFIMIFIGQILIIYDFENWPLFQMSSIAEDRFFFATDRGTM